jgi:SAM-dependent methyltransferase
MNDDFIQMQEKWSKDNNLRLIDLGGAINAPEGYESYDRHQADIIGDLNEMWALEDSSVGLLRAHDIIEHLKDPIHTMNEAYRVLAHGGVFDILVPSTDGQGAWCDPTHISFWNKRSFRYYTEKGMRAYIEPECSCKFQIVKLENIMMWEGIPYVQAQLIAIKDGMRYHGELKF